MNTLNGENKDIALFSDKVQIVEDSIKEYAGEASMLELDKLAENFRTRIEDFYRENRKLNIGVIGQVKAGKSSFLNTLLFGGREILPKASTPKTATLTKMEYSEENVIQIEYYSLEEWGVLEDNALVDLDDEIYSSARELVDMVKRNGVDPHQYLEKGMERIAFESYEDLISNLNDYVGEDGKFTPIVKAVTLSLNKEEFKGLSIVDTPGLNDPIASRTIRTKEFMELCDVVFFLSQSGSFLDKSDWILLSSQLPQKGVKKLVLIASKYDSGIRDVLRVSDEDDDFGDDENTADTIPKACELIKRKLRKRAKGKVEEFVQDLERRDKTPELIAVIRQCSEPIMVSSLAYNMSGKNCAEYTSEEKNIYSALQLFSTDMESDLKMLGNFDEVKNLFEAVVSEKETILKEKAKAFVPNAIAELKNLLSGYLEKTNRRIHVLESNDREQLLEQKKIMEERIGSIKGDIAAVFGDLYADLETEKVKGIRELREASKDCLSVKERSGVRTKTGYTQTGHLWWKKCVSYQYEEHYSYCIAADVVESFHRFGVDASNRVEEIFSEALQIKGLKRRLLDIVVNNFDMGSEKYDASLFRVMVEETVSSIEFPVFNINISGVIEEITEEFSGELTSAKRKTELSNAVSTATSKIYEEISQQLDKTVKKFKEELTEIGAKAEASLLLNTSKEFEDLLGQCDDKDKEIARYKTYAAILETEIDKL